MGGGIGVGGVQMTNVLSAEQYIYSNIFSFETK